MTYLIDAWLDRPHPYLRILHRETGEVCAVLEEAALDELRDQGDLDLNGLNSSEPIVLKELVRNLFLFCYARALRPNTPHAGFQLIFVLFFRASSLASQLPQ